MGLDWEQICGTLELSDGVNDAIRASDKVSYCITGEGRHEDGVEWSLTFRSVIVFGRMRVLEDEEDSLRLARLFGEKFT